MGKVKFQSGFSLLSGQYRGVSLLLLLGDTIDGRLVAEYASVS